MAERKKVTLSTLISKQSKGELITMITCYDFAMADLVEKAEIDIVLVGDSLGMTLFGLDSTLPVTLDTMVAHVKAVRIGSPNCWLVGDMPYMTYQPSTETAIRSAGRLMAEGECDVVKLEGGREMADRIEGIVRAGIPCMGHLGLTPQSVAALGGLRVQGRGAAQAKRIIDDAKAIEEAGCSVILLEMVPDRVCQIIHERADVPIISLGCGPHADGQLLIFHDMFGLYPKFKPRMAKVFGDAGKVIGDGLKQYVSEVTSGQFPQPENWFGIKDDEYDELLDMLDE
jgi:3-methyl-2-oxobutanoate hydroxymethyltransferase